MTEQATSYRIDGNRTAWRTTGNESVLLDLGTSTYFGLNQSAGVLWSALLTGSTFDGLVDALLAATPAPAGRDQAASEVQAFLRLLDDEMLLLTAASDG